DVRGAAERHLRQQLVGGGIAHLAELRRGRVDPAPADVVLDRARGRFVAVDHRGRLFARSRHESYLLDGIEPAESAIAVTVSPGSSERLPVRPRGRGAGP